MPRFKNTLHESFRQTTKFPFDKAHINISYDLVNCTGCLQTGKRKPYLKQATLSVDVSLQTKETTN